MSIPFLDVTVPVDCSETAKRGIDYAIQLASGGTRLHFCSVVDTAPVAAGAMGVPMNVAPVLEALEEDAEQAWRAAVAAAQKSSIVADGGVVYGAVATSVGQYATEVRSDAVVIGTHARRGLSRVVFGSVTESLLATSNIPVVVAHVDDLVQPRGGPITVAVDDSAAARSALMLAIDLAQAWNKALAIVNVTDASREDWRHAADLLEEVADAARVAEVDFELVTVGGRVAEAVVDGAHRRGSSMIVVGTETRSSAMRLVFGSVAASILERARIPVTVVPQR